MPLALVYIGLSLLVYLSLCGFPHSPPQFITLQLSNSFSTEQAPLSLAVLIIQPFFITVSICEFKFSMYKFMPWEADRLQGLDTVEDRDNSNSQKRKSKYAKSYMEMTIPGAGKILGVRLLETVPTAVFVF